MKREAEPHPPADPRGRQRPGAVLAARARPRRSAMREEFDEIFDSELPETAQRLLTLVVDDRATRTAEITLTAS